MKRRFSILSACILAIACLFSACQSAPADPPAVSADPAPLSAEEAAKLQEEFTPSNSGGTPSTVDTTVEAVMEQGWLPVYAQVTGEEETVEKAYGNMDAFRIPIKILHDPNGRYEDGQEVVLFNNTMVRGLLPELKKGDLFVAPMKNCADSRQDSNDLLRVTISDTGCYTITQDGHAIAVYREKNEFQHNGVGLATLLNEFDALEKDSANS